MSSENDLAHHYKVLKQFLDISDDLNSRSQSNSNRAIKAREKLLKLSPAQFKELSTDVYDELKRRIDESRGEPDFLLPKSSFHPKRNQARHKLASLPQSRFKDLVSDISYEIERRDLHTPSNTSPTKSESSNHNHQDSIDHSSPTKSLNSNHLHNQNQSINIQPKTVVPTKANLTWSSDEEEEEEEEGDDENKAAADLKNDLQNKNISQRSLHSNQSSQSQDVKLLMEEGSKMDKLITELKTELNESKNSYQELSNNHQSLQNELDQLIDDKKSLNNEIENLLIEKQNWKRNSQPDENVLKELDNLKSLNASLRLENQSLKNSHSKDINRNSKNMLSSSPSNSFDQSNDLKKQLEIFYDKLSHLDNPNINSNPNLSLNTNEITQLKNEVIKWQKRYEDSRSNIIIADLANLSFSDHELKSLVSPTGLVSMKLVADLQASIESFLLYINESSFDSDLLFDKISRISILSNEVATQGDAGSLNSNEQSVCLRESTSHALTATRYFALYSSLLPKIVIDRALSEICFTLCDLVSVSKLNSESINSTIIDSSIIQANKNLTNNNKKKDEVMVKPLRITNKLRESQSNDSNSPKNLYLNTNDSFNKRSVSNSSQASPLNNGDSYKVSPQSASYNGSTDNQPSRSLENKALTNQNLSNFQNDKAPNGEYIASPVASLLNKQASPNRSINNNNNSSPSKNGNYSDVGETPTRIGVLPNSISPLRDNEYSPIKNKVRSSDASFDKSPKGSNSVKSLASKFSESENNSPQELSPRGKAYLQSKVGDSISNKSSPTSRGIFDRVKKFESPTEESIKKESPFRSSPSQSIASRRSSLGLEGDESVGQIKNSPSQQFLVNRSSLEVKDSKDTLLSEPFVAGGNANSKDISGSANNGESSNARNSTTAASPAAAAAAAASATAAATAATTDTPDSGTSTQSTAPALKPRGLFQSIRDRFTSDNQSKPAEDNTSEISDNDRNEVSTEKATSTAETTPAKDTDMDQYDYNDSQETSPSERSEQAFFQSFKGKLTPHENGENFGASRAPSSAASDITIRHDDSNPGNENNYSNPYMNFQNRSVNGSSLNESPVKSGNTEANKADEPGSSNSHVGSHKDETDYAESKNSSPLNSAAHASPLKANGASPLKSSAQASPMNNGAQVSSPLNTGAHIPSPGQSSQSQTSPLNVGGANIESPAQSSQSQTSPLNIAGGSSIRSPAQSQQSIGNDSPLNVAPPNAGAFDDASSIFSGPTPDSPSQAKSPSNVPEKASPISKSVGFASSPPTQHEAKDYSSSEEEEEEDDDEDEEDDDEVEARQRQEYRKSMAAATFNIDLFDIDDPDNTLTHVLLYLEHQTVQVISTIQSLLSAIKKPDATRGELREKSKAITIVISQMAEATNTSMNQTRNFQLKKHGSWVVTSLEDCNHRMNILCRPNSDKNDADFADKNFKQRLAGISFDIAKCTKELVKTVEEASLKEEISNLNAKLSHDDLT